MTDLGWITLPAVYANLQLKYEPSSLPQRSSLVYIKLAV